MATEVAVEEKPEDRVVIREYPWPFLGPSEMANAWCTYAKEVIISRREALIWFIITLICFGLAILGLNDLVRGFTEPSPKAQWILTSLLVAGGVVSLLLTRRANIWAMKCFGNLHELGGHARIITWNHSTFEIVHFDYLFAHGKVLSLPPFQPYISGLTMDFRWPDEMEVILCLVMRNGQDKTIYFPKISIRRNVDLDPQCLLPNREIGLVDYHHLPQRISEWFKARLDAVDAESLLDRLRVKAEDGAHLLSENAIEVLLLDNGQIAANFPYQVTDIQLGGPPQVIPNESDKDEIVVGVIKSKHSQLPFLC